MGTPSAVKRTSKWTFWNPRFLAFLMPASEFSGAIMPPVLWLMTFCRDANDWFSSMVTLYEMPVCGHIIGLEVLIND